MSSEVAIVCVIVWLLCPIADGVAASGKEAVLFGVLCGLLLGPLGVVAALGLDDRPKCPRCGERLNSDRGKTTGRKILFSTCPHCHCDLQGIASNPPPLP
jgi:hypothetical protein